MLELRPYQTTGVDWLLAQPGNAMLFDEQGLGKTVIAATAAARVRRGKRLVLAPSVVLWNWAREVTRWTGLSVCVLDRAASRIDPAADVVVTTHGLILRPQIRAQLLAQTWGLLIVDEAHVFRNRTAKRTRVLYFGDRPIAGQCETTWLLSGTPVPNDISELWTHLRALFPETINRGRPLSFEQYRDRYCYTRPSDYGDGVKVIANNLHTLPELRAAIRPHILRRRESDELKLPPLRFERVALTPDKLPPELVKLFAATDAAGLHPTDDPHEMLAATLDHVQMSRFRRLCGMAKVAPVVELLRSELEHSTRKVVVFAHHAEVVMDLAHGLRKFGALTITGATTTKARDERVHAFQTGPAQVMVCNLVAGGVGTTLTAARECVIVEPSWSPGENAQAIKRIHRFGQTGRTRVRFMSLAGSLDDIVADVAISKTKMIRGLLDE